MLDGGEALSLLGEGLLFLLSPESVTLARNSSVTH